MANVTSQGTTDYNSSEQTVETLSKATAYENGNGHTCGSHYEEETKNNNQEVEDTDSDLTPEGGGTSWGKETSIIKPPPGTPSYIAKDANSLTFQWEAVQSDDAVSPVYEVDLQQVDVIPGSLTPNSRTARTLVDPAEWMRVYSGKECWTRVKDLRPGCYYAVRIQCWADNWKSDYSAVTVLHTTPTIPSKPSPPQLVFLEQCAMTLKWNAPLQNGGSEIHTYRLQMQPSITTSPIEFKDVYVGPDLTIRILNLSPSMKYTARVVAVNDVGESPWSLPSCFTTKPMLPSIPQHFCISSMTPFSVKLEWCSDKRRNGRDRDQYEIEVENVEQQFCDIEHIGDVNYCTIDGLEFGHNYRFRVRAKNWSGISDWSAAVDCSLAACPPSPPLHLSITSTTEEGVAIAWCPPQFPGSASSMQYQVEVVSISSTIIEGHMQTWQIVYRGPRCQCFLYDLMPGHEYCTRVVAINEVGCGMPSLLLKFKTPPSLPQRPTTPQAIERHGHLLRLHWEKPVHDGGNEIQGYRLQMCTTSELTADDEMEPFEDVYEGGRDTIDLTDLQCGVVYAFRVCAVNDFGDSEWSHICHETLPLGPPLPPQNLHVCLQDSRSIHLQWDGPEVDGGAPIISYVIELAQLNQNNAFDMFRPVYNNLSTECIIADLEPSASYLIKAKAVNEKGDSEWSKMLSITMTAHLPSTPTQLEVFKATCTTVDLAWRPTLSNNSGTVIYVVEFMQEAESNWKACYEGEDSACCIEDLSAGTEYSIRVRAIVAGDSSIPSEPIVVSTSSLVPSQPQAPSIVQISSSAVRIKWTIPEGNGRQVEAFKIEVHGDDGALYQVPMSGPVTFVKIGELTPQTEYQLRLAAMNEVGWSLWSDPVQCFTKALPPATPFDTKARVAETSSSSLAISWSMPKDTSSELMYEIEAFIAGNKKSKNAQPPVAKTKTSSMLSCTLSELEMGQRYDIRVRAVSSSGISGKWSESVTVRLPDVTSLTQRTTRVSTDKIRSATEERSAKSNNSTGRPRKGQAIIQTTKKKNPLKKRKSLWKMFTSYYPMFITFVLLLAFLVSIIHA